MFRQQIEQKEHTQIVFAKVIVLTFFIFIDIEENGSGKISRKQKIFAKKSIKREKKKEKEQRKKTEKSM